MKMRQISRSLVRKCWFASGGWWIIMAHANQLGAGLLFGLLSVFPSLSLSLSLYVY